MAESTMEIKGQVRTSAGRFKKGQEKDLAKAASKEELQHLTRRGAISGFDTSVKEEETLRRLGPTAATASPADKGALRKDDTNAEAIVNVTAGPGTTRLAPATPEAGEEELSLEDMSRKQLLAKADSLQIDMTTVEGTGKDGYVTMADLIRAIESKHAEAPSGE